MSIHPSRFSQGFLSQSSLFFELGFTQWMVCCSPRFRVGSPRWGSHAASGSGIGGCGIIEQQSPTEHQEVIQHTLSNSEKLITEHLTTLSF